jgi:hypothetical protein
MMDFAPLFVTVLGGFAGPLRLRCLAQAGHVDIVHLHHPLQRER